MNQQLTLGVQLRDDATFDNFFSGNNVVIFNTLRNFVLQSREQFIYIWGNVGSGRSHLLQASCHLADTNNFSNIYFSVAAKKIAPAILEGLENLNLICIDDVEAIAGDTAWEEALFHCYNRVIASGNKMIIAGNAPPKLLNLQLPDLSSRLCAGAIFQLQALTDEHKLVALQLRAQIRGFNLPNEVAQFLLTHYSRDMTELFTLLDKLDHASLVKKRKLTVAFVKEILSA